MPQKLYIGKEAVKSTRTYLAQSSIQPRQRTDSETKKALHKKRLKDARQQYQGVENVNK
jgi:hypothetical protein